MVLPVFCGRGREKTVYVELILREGAIKLMKIGMATIAFREYDLRHALDVAKAGGCLGVELWGKPAHTPKGATIDDWENIRMKIESRDLKVSVFGSYANPIHEDFDKEVDDAILAAKTLGTGLIRTWAGDVDAKDASCKLWTTCIEGYKRVCDIAGEEGLVLAVETHANSLADTPEGMIKLIDSVGAGNLKANFQLAHADDPGSMERDLEYLGPYIANVHAQNFNVHQGKYKRTSIEHGDIDYKNIVSKLKKLKFDGFIEVEFVTGNTFSDMRQNMINDIEYLRKLIS